MSEAPQSPPSSVAPPLSPWRWSWYLPGIVAVGWGFYGILTAAQGPDLLPWVVFLGAVLIAHDFLIAPVAVVVGWLIARALGAGTGAPRGRRAGILRAPVQVGVAGSAVYVLAGLAYIAGRGVSPDLPSAVPFDYAARVAVLCGVWWTAMAVWALVRYVRRPAPAQAG